jgi:hypothetical protein
MNWFLHLQNDGTRTGRHMKIFIGGWDRGSSGRALA